MAINFPDSPTIGPPATTHTVGDVTWTWDGTTWRATASGGSSYVLPPATTTVLGGVKIDGSTITIDGNGVISSTASGDVTKAASSTDNALVRFDGTNGDTLQNSLVQISDIGQILAPKVEGHIIPFYYNSQAAFPTMTADTRGIIAYSEFDGNLFFCDTAEYKRLANYNERRELTTTSATINNGNYAFGTITGYGSYYLFKIEVSHAAWVIVYSDTISRTADGTRNETEDPLPGSGVIAEVITTGADTVIFTPATIGWNNASPKTSDIYLKVWNKSGSSAAITVTLTVLPIED